MPSLMDLATETRIEIFRYVIPEKVTSQLISSFISGVSVVVAPLPPNPALPLLLISSEVQKEVLCIPKPSLALYLDNTWRDDFPRWLQATSPSYRANFSEFSVSMQTKWRCQNPVVAQQTLDDIIARRTGTDWEAVYTSDAKKAFDHVECTYRSRRAEIASKSIVGVKHSAFLWEEYRWMISGARDFGDGGRTRPRRKCTKPPVYWCDASEISGVGADNWFDDVYGAW